MRRTMPWLLLGSTLALAAVLVAALGTPGGMTDVVNDFTVVLGLACLPPLALALAGRSRSSSRLCKILSVVALNPAAWLAIAAVALAAGATLWPSASGPITAVLAFLPIVAIATLARPTRDAPLTSGTDSTDSLVMPAPRAATDAPRARAA